MCSSFQAFSHSVCCTLVIYQLLMQQLQHFLQIPNVRFTVQSLVLSHSVPLNQGAVLHTDARPRLQAKSFWRGWHQLVPPRVHQLHQGQVRHLQGASLGRLPVTIASKQSTPATRLPLYRRHRLYSASGLRRTPNSIDTTPVTMAVV